MKEIVIITNDTQRVLCEMYHSMSGLDHDTKSYLTRVECESVKVFVYSPPRMKDMEGCCLDLVAIDGVSPTLHEEDILRQTLIRRNGDIIKYDELKENGIIEKFINETKEVKCSKKIIRSGKEFREQATCPECGEYGDVLKTNFIGGNAIAYEFSCTCGCIWETDTKIEYEDKIEYKPLPLSASERKATFNIFEIILNKLGW